MAGAPHLPCLHLNLLIACHLLPQPNCTWLSTNGHSYPIQTPYKLISISVLSFHLLVSSRSVFLYLYFLLSMTCISSRRKYWDTFHTDLYTLIHSYGHSLEQCFEGFYFILVIYSFHFFPLGCLFYCKIVNMGAKLSSIKRVNYSGFQLNKNNISTSYMSYLKLMTLGCHGVHWIIIHVWICGKT